MIRSTLALLTLLLLLGTPRGAAQELRPGVHRTPEARFAEIKDFPFEPHYIEIDGLRMHYVDEGSGEAGTFLLLHGEPVWSYMYRGAIPGLAAAGYRVIAPDNIGFGRSDKVIDHEWYTLDSHVQTLKRLVAKLDLQDITVVVNDWGGPNGLVMATEMPERFERLIILNTWLHHEGYEYTQALRVWNARSQSVDFTAFRGAANNLALLAPFDSPDTTAGALRWPWMLPFAEPEAGNAARGGQERLECPGFMAQACARDLRRLGSDLHRRVGPSVRRPHTRCHDHTRGRRGPSTSALDHGAGRSAPGRRVCRFGVAVDQRGACPTVIELATR